MQRLRDHQKICSNNWPNSVQVMNQKLECGMCSKTFKFPKKLTNHMKSCLCPVCPICQKEFKRVGSRSGPNRLALHLKSCSPTPKPPNQRAPPPLIYKCQSSTCEKMFSNKRAQRSHENHCDNVLFECSRCSMKFRTRQLLGMHKNRCPKFELL